MMWAAVAMCLGQQSGVNPQLPEYIYASRMEQLDGRTPIRLEYNPQVRAYIDAYLVRRRDHLANIIARSQLYFPLFEEYLSKYNLPLELKYLAVIESALDPRAKSKSGAMGLWQFLYHAGLMLDLKVTSYEDERCDPRKSLPLPVVSLPDFGRLAAGPGGLQRRRGHRAESHGARR